VLGPLDSQATPALVRAAGCLGDARIVEPVIANLGSDDARMRCAAAVAAGALNHTRAVPALLRATQDTEQSVRDAGSAALNRMGMAAVIAGLAEIVRGEAAAQVLPHVAQAGEVGPGNGERALPAEVLAQTRDALATEGAQAAPPPQEPAAPGPHPYRGRRGGLVDRLLGRAR
jgi:HEAT repeat protein